MQNQIQMFESKEFGKVRVIQKDGQSWWVLRDVCKAIGLSNPTIVATRLDADEVTKFNLGGLSGESNIISESGLYAVILRSDKPKARTFRKWLTSEVIPAIRKHGAYATAETLNAMQGDPEFTAELIRNLAQTHTHNQVLMDYVGKLQPKAQYYDAILQSTKSLPISVIAKDYGMSAFAMNRLLHELGVQYKIGGTWLLYKKYANLGYTVSKTYLVDGEEAFVHTCWSQKGRRFLYDLLCDYSIYPNAEAAA